MAWKDKFIAKATVVHGGKYDYSKVEYKGSKEKVCIVCPTHGEFWMTPQSHARGQGCPQCANSRRGSKHKDTTKSFIDKAKAVHGDKYDYFSVDYANAMTKVTIICPTHGEFQMTPSAHLSGQGCPKCAGRGLTLEELIARFKDVHGDKYDYSQVRLGKRDEKVTIICPTHGPFLQTPSKHILRAQGCPKCGIESRARKKTMGIEEFVKRAKEVHGERYSYENVRYRKALDKVLITCPKHGDFKQTPNDHLNGHGCPTCGNNASKGEDEIASFINSLGIETVCKDRSVLKDKEIDVLVPSKKLGIEYDGLYWHSSLFKENNYHLSKTEACSSKGIRLIHVFEDEWLRKRPIVESIIRHALGKTEEKICARKCTISEVGPSTRKAFLEENNLFGDTDAETSIALAYDGDIVAMACFNGNILERFCSKVNTVVVGGFSKLIKHYRNGKGIKVLIDRRIGDGSCCEKLGFKFDGITSPTSYAVNGSGKSNRTRELCDNGTETAITDCGCLVYVK